MTDAGCESLILNRFFEKCRIAGGAKAGYVLRKTSIAYGIDPSRESEVERSLEMLVERGVLASNETSSLYFLTAKGVDVLSELDT
jgi:predicted transcriptional regulator